MVSPGLAGDPVAAPRLSQDNHVMTTTPMIPVSWGELLDKITILQIKQARLDDDAKRANVAAELAALADLRLPGLLAAQGIVRGGFVDFIHQ